MADINFSLSAIILKVNGLNIARGGKDQQNRLKAMISGKLSTRSMLEPETMKAQGWKKTYHANNNGKAYGYQTKETSRQKLLLETEDPITNGSIHQEK